MKNANVFLIIICCLDYVVCRIWRKSLNEGLIICPFIRYWQYWIQSVCDMYMEKKKKKGEYVISFHFHIVSSTLCSCMFFYTQENKFYIHR